MFEKGKSGNPNGRPQGAVSQKRLLIDNFVNIIIEEARLFVEGEGTQGNKEKQAIIMSEPYRVIEGKFETRLAEVKNIRFSTNSFIAKCFMLRIPEISIVNH